MTFLLSRQFQFLFTRVVLPPSFATSSQDVDKENAEGRRDVCVGKKCENVAKNALGAPLKTRVNEADFVRASLTPPKGGEKKKSGDDKFSGKRCIEDRVVSNKLKQVEKKTEIVAKIN